jgi:hypothetical protein
MQVLGDTIRCRCLLFVEDTKVFYYNIDRNPLHQYDRRRPTDPFHDYDLRNPRRGPRHHPRSGGGRLRQRFDRFAPELMVRGSTAAPRAASRKSAATGVD